MWDTLGLSQNDDLAGILANRSFNLIYGLIDISKTNMMYEAANEKLEIVLFVCSEDAIYTAQEAVWSGSLFSNAASCKETA